MKPVIQIDVVSDVVCPWCYIGEARIKKAMEAHASQYDFTFTYHPFELNPHMPEEGKESMPFFAEKFGSAARRDEIFASTAATAHAEGLPFDLSLQQVAPNTFKSHQLIALAARHGKQTQVVHDLFTAYFAEGKNLADKTVLKEVAANHQLPENETDEVLHGDAYSNEVSEAQIRWRKLGITSVPSFIIQNKYLVQGAQPPEAFAVVFADVAPAVQAGDQCTDDTCST